MSEIVDYIPVYHAFLSSLSPPHTKVPPLELVLVEGRGGGWTGTAHVRPKVVGGSHALQAILGTGLTPGSAFLVQLSLAGTSEPVRTWPCILTWIHTRESADSPEAFCVIGFSDPLTVLSERPIWFGWSAVRSDETPTEGETVLAELVGGALSAAAGGDPRPDSAPSLTGLPAVTIDADVDAAVESPPYVVAAGQSLGLWLEQICGHLGVRIELAGLPSGALHIHLTDRPPGQSRLNRAGPISIESDYSKPPSPNSIRLGSVSHMATAPVRRGLLDSAASGSPVAFGPPGGFGNVVTDVRLDSEEAERRSAFGAESDDPASLRTGGLSGQPLFTPGRLVEITGRDAPVVNGESDTDGQSSAPSFGGEKWQVVSVVHLYIRGSYWNRAEFEHSELPWRPQLRSEAPPVFVSGWVDDGESDPGQPVRRDALGRLPVRLVFSQPVTDFAEGRIATHYYPALKLSPVSPIAGNFHGYVSDHRQQDWCRVQVHTPLHAEVIGFVYRDDRTIKPSVRDVTAGMLVSQGPDAWRGWVFQPGGDTAQSGEDAG